MTMQTPRRSRRSFLKGVLAASVAPLVVPGRVLGLNGATAPSNRLHFGIIGMGNRCRYVMPNLFNFENARFVAVSDCRADRLASGKELIDNQYGNSDCATYPDFRELLARPEIDGVFIATGNRWHTPASVYAARAGKDVYLEKPISLTIGESRALVENCRRLGTVLQVGTQRRSTGSYRFAREMVLQGKIGKLHTVEMQCWAVAPIPHAPNGPVPAGVDYDRWLGQVPWRPFNPARFSSWHNFFDYSDGIITDMGCHYTDQMQWVLGTDDTGPVEFEGRAEWPDPAKYMSEVPLSCEVRARYANGVTGVMVQRKGFDDRYIKYIGDEGWIQVDDGTDLVTAEPKSILNLRNTAGGGWGDITGHFADLLHCMRNRAKPVCHPEAGHRAQTISLAMTIAMRLERKLKWDPQTERFDDESANRLLWREPRAPWRL